MEESQEERRHRKALSKVIGSVNKFKILEAFDQVESELGVKELQKRTGISGIGTLYYHLRDLQLLGLVEHTKSYGSYYITDLGKRILKEYKTLLQKADEEVQ